MFRVASPSIAVNDDRAPMRYQMDATIDVHSTTTVGQIVASILEDIDRLNVDRLENLILTAHGQPGHYMLGTGLNILTMGPFEQLRGKVTRIWFRGCLIARIIDEQTPGQGDAAALRHFGFTSGNGHVFISSFARLTGCFVIAPTEMQAARRRVYPQGILDTYEGLVLRYNPEGNIVWQRRYPSLYDFNPRENNIMSPNQE